MGRIIVIIFLLISDLAFGQTVSKRSEIIENYKGAPYYMHFVQMGETVQSIAQLYGVTNVELLEANPEIASGLKPDRVIRVPVRKQAAPAVADDNEPQSQDPPGTWHLVQPKETWYGIARQYKVTVKELISMNPQVDTLKIGMKVRIPELSGKNQVITGNYAEHTVKPQETLYSLAKRYNTTIDEITRLNPVLADGLKVGQVLMVPVSSMGGDPEVKIQVTDTSFIEHVVERKETLYGIARLYNVDQNDIIRANPGFDGKLKKGNKLRIPKVFKEVKPYTRPDTVIMGRRISEAAKENPLKGPCNVIHNNRREFNIALMVPMQLELVDSISVSDPAGLKSANEYASFDFIQFYEGAVIAADSMARRGMNVKIHVFDADHLDGTSKTKKALAKPEMAGMDLIIGPFFAKSFSMVADFAKKNNIPVINPLSQRSEILEGNEYLVKLQPSGWAQYNALGSYLREAHGNDNIILVRKNAEENKSMGQVISSELGQSASVKEVIYSQGGWQAISKNLSAGRPNIVVLMITDKAVLPALLRELADKAGSHNISVVGMPEWEEMELDYNYLMKLNTHFYKPWFVEYDSPEAKRFIIQYRERFVGEPEVEKLAYLGYDATLYFLDALYNYGNGFMNCIESISKPGLSNDFRFVRTSAGGVENYGTAVFKYTDFKREKLN